MARITTYTTSRDFTLDTTFQCLRCAYASPVKVNGSFHAVGRGSAQAAVHDAESGAYMQAHERFDLLKCPRCGTRSAKGDDREKRAVRNVRIYLYVTLPVLVLGMILAEASSPYTPLRSASLLLLVVAVPATLVNGWRVIKSFSFPKDTNMHATFAVAPQGVAGMPPQAPQMQMQMQQPQMQMQQPQMQQPQTQQPPMGQPYPQQQPQSYPHQPAYPQQPYPQAQPQQPYPQAQPQQPYPQAQPQQPYPQQPQGPQGPPPGYPGPGPYGRR